MAGPRPIGAKITRQAPNPVVVGEGRPSTPFSPRAPQVVDGRPSPTPIEEKTTPHPTPRPPPPKPRKPWMVGLRRPLSRRRRRRRNSRDHRRAYPARRRFISGRRRIHHVIAEL